MNEDSAIVKTTLEQLFKSCCSEVDLSCVDEIVVSYVCGVVEEIASGDEDDVDSVGMKDVMTAYIPNFSSIPDDDVEIWVRKMVTLTLEEKQRSKVNKDITLDSILSSFSAAHTRNYRSSSSLSDSSERLQKISETSDSSEDLNKITKEDIAVHSQYAESLAILSELFPASSSLEVKHCLSSAGGNIEEATSLLLEREEQGLSIKVSPACKIVGKTPKIADEKAIRNNILNKYGFIDRDDDHKEHRPVAPKWEGKKMVRYRDSKVVSLKGERYTEVKKEESEGLKKTYVNLKPGKQYKFH